MPPTSMLFVVTAAASIAIRGVRSLVATTTVCCLGPEPALGLIATSTKAAITSRARTIPRIVNGLREVSADRLERAKAGSS